MQRKLLIVDDEVGILRALRRLFRKSNYQVLIAESAEEALEIFAREDIPVILSDFRMPGADGGALLQRATELDPTCVGLILSGYAELKQIIDAFNSGAVYRFISKPWVDADLLEQVNNAFSVAEQKRSDIALNQTPIVDQLEREYRRLYPVSLVDELHSESDWSQLLFAVEFAPPRLALADEGLDTQSAMAQLIKRLLTGLPETVSFCHWNGYTLMLLLPSSALAEVEARVQESAAILRYAHSTQSEVSGADRVRQVLVDLAHAGADRAEFVGSEWHTLLDAQLSETIVRAINDMAFSVVFQPIASDAGELRAVEALLRCHCPVLTGTELSITALIRHIDLLGYTDRFSELQFELALDAFAQLVLPDSVKLVLNLSVAQCSSPHLKSALTQQLERRSLTFERLSIDVSESALRSKAPGCMQNLQWLSSSSAELTLDDQGAAHACFNKQEVLGVDAVKLDRAFLHDLQTHSNRQDMLLNLCDRIAERGKRLIFEGVENQDQLAFLQEHYQFTYQGYYLSPPLSPVDLQEWLSRREIR